MNTLMNIRILYKSDMNSQSLLNSGPVLLYYREWDSGIFFCLSSQNMTWAVQEYEWSGNTSASTDDKYMGQLADEQRKTRCKTGQG